MISISEENQLIFGKRPVEELLRNAPRRIHKIIIRTNSNNESVPFEQELSDTLAQFSLEVSRVCAEEFQELLTGKEEVNHQGIAAEVKLATAVKIEELFDIGLSNSKSLLVVLDEVQDPHNVGAIFRSCEALGACGLILTERRTSPVNSTVRRISTGASEFIPFSRVKNLARVLEMAKKKGYWVYGSSLSDTSTRLASIEFSNHCLLVLGSESKGIRHQTEKLCDVLIKIDQYGLVNSLNVSTAASVIVYEVMKQLKGN